MLDEEFFKQYPVSEYHGIHYQDGTILAKLFNTNISEKIFVTDEEMMYDAILQAREHQTICPKDSRNAAEIAVMTKALLDVQAEKILCGFPLERPRLAGQSNSLTLVQGGLDSLL